MSTELSVRTLMNFIREPTNKLLILIACVSLFCVLVTLIIQTHITESSKYQKYSEDSSIGLGLAISGIVILFLYFMFDYASVGSRDLFTVYLNLALCKMAVLFISIILFVWGIIVLEFFNKEIKRNIPENSKNSRVSLIIDLISAIWTLLVILFISDNL